MKGWYGVLTIAQLACMIGIDKGLLDLHDPSCVEKYCPELCAQKILKGYSDDGKAIYADRTQPIRLWHLLTHTAGELVLSPYTCWIR